MSILAIGSIATDYILKYDNNLKESLEKESLQGKVNMSVRAPELSKESGGTGLNLVYNLALLGESSILLGAIGKDFVFSDFIQEHVNLNYVHVSELYASSSSYITRDDFGNQISVFYPGAMKRADYMKLEDIKQGFEYAIVSATKKEAMFDYLYQLKALGTKVFFDPGQQLSAMSKEELLVAITLSHYLIVNEHEWELFQKISGLCSEEIIRSFEKIIVTSGEKGSKIMDLKEVVEVPALQVDEVLDVTGVGEAYRAGLLMGITRKYSWELSAKMGTLLASFCLGAHGAQNHFIDKKQFEMWFAGEYKEFIKL